MIARLKTGSDLPPLAVMWCMMELAPADSPAAVILHIKLIKEGLPVGISTKTGNILLYPPKCCHLVQEASVCCSATLLE